MDSTEGEGSTPYTDPANGSDPGEAGSTASEEPAVVRRRSSSRESAPAKKPAPGAKKPGPRKAVVVRAPVKKKTLDDDHVLAERLRAHMKSANRPFGVAELLLHFKGDVGKTTLQKALGTLAEEGAVYAKGYGKVSVYCVVQDAVDVDAEALAALDRAVEARRVETGVLREEAERLGRQLAAMNAHPSDEVLRGATEALGAEVQRLEAKLGALGTGSVEAGAMKKAEAEIRRLEAEARRRRSALRSIVDSLCEGTGLRRSELLVEIGLE